MDNEEKQTIDFWLQFRKNWPVVLVIVSIISSWTYFQFQLNNLSSKLNEDELKIASLDAQFNTNFTELKSSISGIDAKVTILLDKYLKGN